jgi:hypothetical protein
VGILQFDALSTGAQLISYEKMQELTLNNNAQLWLFGANNAMMRYKSAKRMRIIVLKA